MAFLCSTISSDSHGFIKVTVRVTFKFIHLERFRLGAGEDLGKFFVTDVSDNRSYLEKKARSMFQFLASRTQLVEERLLCLSLSRFERFSASLVCNVLPILSWGFPPLLEYFLLAMR